MSQLSAKALFEQDKIKDRFREMLGEKSSSFMISVLQIVGSNELLSKCEPLSVYNVACVAASLDLPLNNNLGYAYIIPYKQKYVSKEVNAKGVAVDIWREKYVAQFQIGYKGLVQLAHRTNQYKACSVTEIYEGQLLSANPLKGNSYDFTKRKSGKIIGFAAYFSLISGFEKDVYVPIDEVIRHGRRYSKSFETGLWKTDLVKMGCKTVLKLLLSKFGPLSIEMQRAVKFDQAVVNDEKTEDVTYVDNEPVEVPEDIIEAEKNFSKCKTIEKLDELFVTMDSPDLKDEIRELYANRKKAIIALSKVNLP